MENRPLFPLALYLANALGGPSSEWASDWPASSPWNWPDSAEEPGRLPSQENHRAQRRP